MKKERILNLILPLISIVCVLVVWGVASALVGSDYILPSVGQTFVSVLQLFGQYSFFLALGATLLRALIAFALSFIIAFGLAFWGYKNKKVKRFLSPLISVIRALPTIAIVLLLLFWTNSLVAPVVVTMLVVLPTTYTGLTNAFGELDEQLKQTCQVFGVSKKQIFLKVQLPAIMPSMYSLIGSGISLNLKLMVAAEVLSATVRSIGNLLNYASYNGEMSTMLALVVVTVIIGVAVEAVFNYLSKKAGWWK